MKKKIKTWLAISALFVVGFIVMSCDAGDSAFESDYIEQDELRFYLKKDGSGYGVEHNGKGGYGTTITIPASVNGIPVVTIMPDAFKSCMRLTSITIPASVTSIGSSAFSNTGIINNVPENSVAYADKWVVGYDVFGTFSDISLRTNTVGISTSALSSRSIRSIIIPSSVLYINEKAFRSCDNLTRVTFERANITMADNFVFPGVDLEKKYAAGGSGTYIKTGNNWAKQ